MADTITDVNEAFRFLRPITVPVTQNHDVESVERLLHVLDGGKLSDPVLQEMHEYIAFPLRLVLKQYGHSDEKVCIATLRCLIALLKKTNIVKSSIFMDLFENLLSFVNPVPSLRKATSEEMRFEAVEALTLMFKRCDVSCYSSMIIEVLPLMGSLIQGGLDTVAHLKMKKLQIATLNLITLLMDSRDDRKLTVLLERMMPTYLPGVVTGVLQILDVQNQKSKVMQMALKIMWIVICVAFRKSEFSDAPDVKINTTNFQSMVEVFMVERNEKWYKEANKNLHVALKHVGTRYLQHDSWQVRRELTEWAFHILLKCDQYLPDSHGILLDIVVHNLEDGYPQVAGLSQNRLRELTKTMDNVGERLRFRIYLQASKLPRVLHKNDQVMSLQMLRLFNGYLNALSDEIAHLLRCHVHLHRITIALCAILKLDCTSVKVLDTAKSDHQLSVTDCVFPVLRRQYTSFTDILIWREIQTSIKYFVNHGDLYPLVDNFMSEFQNDLTHRLACAIILNEILTAHIELADGVENEVVDICRSVLELYSDTYRQISNQSDDSNIKQKNEYIQLQCLLLEGFVIIHQVTGESYPELLLNSLYSLLESCAHHNILIKQTAVTGLTIISSAFQYSGAAELIEKHCNYLCNTLSLNIRQLHRYPTSASVLCSVLQYSHSTILPYIEQIIVEVLYSLDDNYTDDAMLLLRVPQILLRQLCIWYPISTSETLPASQLIAASTAAAAELRTSDRAAPPAEVICDYVRIYYENRLEAENIDLSTDDDNADLSVDDNIPEEVEELEKQEESAMDKKNTPLHISLAKKVLERCNHLISHSSTKVRLITIDMIADGCRVVSHSQDDLLPSVHDVWSGFCKRFADAEPLVVLKAINCLGVLGDLSKDFIRAKVTKEILPHFSTFLNKKLSVSEKAGTGYKHTLDYRLQLKALQVIGQLCTDLKLGQVSMEIVIESCLPYLTTKQPQPLQEAALSTITQISESDSDLIWYHLNSLRENNADFGHYLDQTPDLQALLGS